MKKDLTTGSLATTSTPAKFLCPAFTSAAVYLSSVANASPAIIPAAGLAAPSNATAYAAACSLRPAGTT